MPSKNVIAQLTKIDKLDGTNYDINHGKTHYMLKEVEVLETPTNAMIQHKEWIIPEHHFDPGAYKNWFEKDCFMHFTMLSSVHDDGSEAFKSYAIA